MDHVEAGGLRFHAQRIGFLVRQVGHDHAIGAGVDGGASEALETEREHRVVVREEHQRQPHLGAERRHELEHARKRGARRQRARAGALDHRAVGERIREGNAQLDEVGAGVGVRPCDAQRRPGVGEAAHHVGHQRGPALAAGRGEGGGDPLGAGRRPGRLSHRARPRE